MFQLQGGIFSYRRFPVNQLANMFGGVGDSPGKLSLRPTEIQSGENVALKSVMIVSYKNNPDPGNSFPPGNGTIFIDGYRLISTLKSKPGSAIQIKCKTVAPLTF